jgi:hypothetical protein
MNLSSLTATILALNMLALPSTATSDGLSYGSPTLGIVNFELGSCYLKDPFLLINAYPYRLHQFYNEQGKCALGEFVNIKGGAGPSIALTNLSCLDVMKCDSSCKVDYRYGMWWESKYGILADVKLLCNDDAVLAMVGKHESWNIERGDYMVYYATEALQGNGRESEAC